MTSQAQGPIVAGSAVVLVGDSLKHALDAVLVAARTRDRNGLPRSATQLALAQALAEAMSANRHSDVREPEELEHYPQVEPTVPIEEASKQLNLSTRQTIRLAPKLGGKKISGRWFLDQAAIDEHKEGQK
jgi:hypothetical protein